MLQAGDPLPGEASDGAGGEDGRLAEFDGAVAEIAVRVDAASAQAEGWLEQTRAGLTEMLLFCDERPDAARELVVESIAWGPEVLERRGRLLDTLADALDRGRARVVPIPENGSAVTDDALNRGWAWVAPTSENSSVVTEGALPMPPQGTAENLVGACVSLVHTRLLQAEAPPLLELAPSLMSMIAHPYLGPKVARRELEQRPTCAGVEASKHESRGTVAGVREETY